MVSRAVSYMYCALAHPERVSVDMLTDNPFVGRSIFKGFVLPWCAAVAAVTLVSYCIYAEEFRSEAAVLKPLFAMVSLLSAYIASVLLCMFTSRRFLGKELDRTVAETVTAYAFLPVFVLRVVLGVMPNMFFLKALLLYVLYMLWVFAGDTLKFGERERQIFMLVNGASVILMPWLVQSVLRMLVPNIAM